MGGDIGAGVGGVEGSASWCILIESLDGFAVSGLMLSRDGFEVKEPMLRLFRRVVELFSISCRIPMPVFPPDGPVAMMPTGGPFSLSELRDTPLVDVERCKSALPVFRAGTTGPRNPILRSWSRFVCRDVVDAVASAMPVDWR